ncbi:unnamed protein product [Dibothriocephalus latus]|uniref:G-protein coupled receptors family 1 profile domain-containing protein n=1 Tax=Dibothriocephalus latus TaxID=60516 RepID=A0A3P7QX04_DIBLA|nr:unnamed protein product [Dibothriocephalus latus]
MRDAEYDKRCLDDADWPSTLDIASIVLDLLSFIFNLTATVILARLRAKKMEDLALLRVLSASCLAVAFSILIGDGRLHGIKSGNPVLERIICLFLSTQFFFWFTYALAHQAAFSSALNRALVMLKPEQQLNLRVITPKQSLTANLVVVFGISFLFMSPQFLLTRIGEDCAYDPLPTEIPLLSLVYAHNYLWVAILGIFTQLSMVYISISMILHAHSTEREGLVDELDGLYFPHACEPPYSSESPSGTSRSFERLEEVPDSGRCGMRWLSINSRQAFIFISFNCRKIRDPDMLSRSSSPKGRAEEEGAGSGPNYI